MAFLVVAAVAASACGGKAHSYGGLPSWLPHSTLPVHRVVVATATRPQIGVEGDPIAVHLPTGQAVVTAVGPYDTIQGRYPVPATTPCTMVVTLHDTAGTIPIDPAEFTFVDELGHRSHPEVSDPGGRVPAATHPDATVTLRLRHVLPTGNGQLQWSPGGGAAIASWDFSVEID